MPNNVGAASGSRPERAAPSLLPRRLEVGAITLPLEITCQEAWKMNPSIKLLDKFTQACGYASDSAAARALHVQPSAVNNWRRERAHPNASAVEKMCAATGEEVRAWLPLIEAQRARTPDDRKVWLRLAHGASAVALIISFGLLNVQTSNTTGLDSTAHNPGRLYIM
jgi:transcriptional regulator with XRE-family HTH domain